MTTWRRSSARARGGRDLELNGRSAVVTGGHSGIGAAVCRRLAAKGAKPVAWGAAPGAESGCDGSRPEGVSDAMRRTLERGPAPELLVTCAGTGSLSPVLEMTTAEWERVLGVNLRGTLLCIQAIARELVARGRPG